MTIDDVADFFSRPIAFHRCLVRVGGGVTSGLMLSQAVYWQRVVDRKEPGAWWYKSGAEWMEETGLTRDEFQGARRKLVDGGVIKYEVRGMPATGHYRVDFQALLASLLETRKLDCGKPANLVAENLQTLLRETSNPLTTEITKDLQRGRAHGAHPATKAEKKSTIPDDFVLSDALKSWGAEHGLAAAYVEQQFEAFADDARANRRLHADWPAAFKGWLRRQPNFDRGAPRPVRGARVQAQAIREKRCCWPKRDAPDRCTVVEDLNWVGDGICFCGSHLNDVLERQRRESVPA